MFSRMIRIASLLLATTMMFGTVAAACSNSSVTGTYGFVASGTNSKNRPSATVGQFTATPGTPQGTLAGTETISVNGTLSTFAITGTYQVAVNCIGLSTINIAGLKPLHFRFVVVSGGNEIDSVETDANQIVTGYALAQGSATCTNQGVGTNYGFQNGGPVVGFGNIGFTGRLVFDGNGGATGTESGSEAGAIVTGVPLSGTYSINADCTGNGTITPEGGVATNFNFVVVNGGKTLLAIETDPMTVVTGTLKR